MSKYANLIQEARKQDDQNSDQQETKIKINTPLKVKKPESQKARKPESQKSVKHVNLSIKVNESDRRHWVSEAKRQGTSLTAVIIKSLTEKFGQPEK